MGMGGSSASVSENRVTISLTWLQHRWLREGANADGIGLSEHVRRILDEARKKDLTAVMPNNRARN